MVVEHAGPRRDLGGSDHFRRIKILQSHDLHPPDPEELEMPKAEREREPQGQRGDARAEKPQPSLQAALSHRTSSGATRVMSPAPRVSTTSPGWSASRTRRLTSARTASKR